MVDQPPRRQPRRTGKDVESASLRMHVPADLHRAAKARAAKEGMTLTAWVVQLIRDALAR